MSVLQNPIVGRMKQKIGGVVMTTWKGINVMKGKPLTVANPRTDAQLMRRSALTQIVAIARTISAALNFGFREQAVRKSAFNAFTGYNLRNAFNYTAPPAATIVPADILVSQGTIASTPIATSVADQSAGEITITWASQPNAPGQSNADIPKLAAYNSTTDTWAACEGGTAVRSDLAETFTVPDGFMVAGNTVRLYFFFYNSTNRKSSDSTTGTTVVVA